MAMAVDAYKVSSIGKSVEELSLKRKAVTRMGESCRFHAAKKNFVREIIIRSYRKPTQVDGMNILRCSSEPWLRNSAN